MPFSLGEFPVLIPRRKIEGRELVFVHNAIARRRETRRIWIYVAELSTKKWFYSKNIILVNFPGHSIVRKWMLLSNPQDKGGDEEEAVSIVIYAMNLDLYCLLIFLGHNVNYWFSSIIVFTH